MVKLQYLDFQGFAIETFYQFGMVLHIRSPGVWMLFEFEKFC
jgi:hypothetical protein